MDSSNLFDVKGKIILITGGAKGVGRMISEGFVTNGATVYITGRDVPACDKAVKELNALAKGKAVSLPANLYNEEECKKLFDEFFEERKTAGLHHLSRVLANHLGRRNITSNTLACGPFESKMMAATLKKYKDVIESGVPLGRIGTPEDVAGACLFLSSRAGSYVNGATITLDGGSIINAKM
ncbi:conserved hypothetical protein [Histoplasma mississippiense (nom. inval.)]|uniref:conserved hypothetical protein n=1 Tax=Ajellomyces capsulatus (strain NAm1 / WU24) TaxID=2059318 RepID=UPI000157CD59|nr:conserved hypothetical protein [Histoplasma mississippiense (nom. inval.)]EDN10379.1 conserved hypothetical protein [Histoplasma mississippiense (nom. inval.)]